MNVRTGGGNGWCSPWPIKTVVVYFVVNHHKDSHGNCRADTCAQTQLRGQVLFAQPIKELSFILWSSITKIAMVILELIHAPRPNFVDGLCLLGTEPTQALPGPLVIHGNRTNRIASAGDGSFKFLTYQLPTVGYWPTVAMTGNGELGFDSGEGAWETATTSKEGSRRANYPILTQGGSDKK